MQAGGAVAQLGSTGSIESVSFYNNSAGAFGGALLKSGASGGNITQNGFFSNTAGTAGGALYEQDTQGSVISNRFSGNAAPQGPAVATTNSTQVAAAQNQFIAPQAATDVANS